MGKINISNSEHYRWGDKCDGWHLLKRDDASVIKEKMPPGTSEQTHLHEKSRQFFYVLKGIATFFIQGEEISVGPGEGFEIEPKTLF